MPCPESQQIAKQEDKNVSISKCPDCAVRLGNFLYADACPHCGAELKHNTRPLLSAPKQDIEKPKAWPIRMFLNLARFVES